MFIFHADRVLALSFILRAVFADNVAAEYFDFGDEVRGVRGVAEHCVDEVFFVTVKATRQLTGRSDEEVQWIWKIADLSLVSKAN